MFKFAIILSFLSRLAFSYDENLIGKLHSTYGVEGLKLYYTYWGLSKKIRKTRLDLEFLKTCKSYDIFPKFLRFKLYKKNLRGSRLYRTWQDKLLNFELADKSKSLRTVSAKLAEFETSLRFFSFFHRVRIKCYVTRKLVWFENWITLKLSKGKKNIA